MTLGPPPVSLDAIVDNPAKVALLTPDERNAAIMRCAALLAALSALAPAPLGSTPTAAPRCLTVLEVAERLGLKPAYVYELVRRGELPARPMGRYVRIPEDVLRDWVATPNRHGGNAGTTPRVSSARRDRRGASATMNAARADAGPVRRSDRRDAQHERPARVRRGASPRANRPTDPSADADGGDRNA